MASEALRAARAQDGVGDRAGLTAATTSHAVAWAVRSRQLLRPLPHTFVDPALPDDEVLRARAALCCAGEGAALSHLTALALWGLPVPATPARRPVDVLVAHRRRPRTEDPAHAAAVQVHRSRHAPDTRVRQGLRVVTLERAVVESWPLLVADAQRAPAVVAVRRRLTTPERLRLQLTAHPRLEGRRALHGLLDLLAAGCHSELELWGHTEVFTGPRFAHLRHQVPVTAGGRRSYLDLYDEAAVLGIELDGREHHDSPRDRERDIARDAALAETGLLTLRFSHRQLTTDPEGCREQAWRVVQVRRAQLHGATGDVDDGA